MKDVSTSLFVNGWIFPSSILYFFLISSPFKTINLSLNIDPIDLTFRDRLLFKKLVIPGEFNATQTTPDPKSLSSLTLNLLR